MSEGNDSGTMLSKSSCASCGIAEVDGIKLKNCNGCYLVKYCSIKCQKEHRKQHKRDCKKRAAELRDELLFTQPESSHKGDCPICCLPLPLDDEKCSMMMCCSKLICNGCDYANKLREAEVRLEQSCPFCREPLPKTDEEIDKQRMKRVEANDPFALIDEGVDQYKKGNYSGAFECYAKAARLGNADAHLKLSSMYDSGDGVEKDEGKSIHHLEEAAIGGHPSARFLLSS